MATYDDQLVVLVGGKLQKIGASDSLEITGSLTANGGFSGSGANLTSIPQSAVDNLTTDISDLQSDVGTAQADATQALADAATADGKAVAAQADATQALADAAAAQADATQALADAATADGKAVAAQADATQALADAATADGKAVAAQADATQALADAAAAQADATQALADAAAAQADASQAISDAAAAQADATQALSDAAAAQATADAALPLAGGTLTGPVSGTSLSLSGDLVVQGDIVSKGQVNVLISDSFLDLNSGNTVSASATAGGLTINVKASGASETATAFVAGVVSTSAPSMAIASSAFVAGDIVQVSGSVDGKNDGLFVVASVSSTTVSIKGVGGTAPAAYVPFVQTQFVAQSAQSAVVTKVDLAVFAVSNGSLASASGSIPTGTFAFDYQAAATEASFASSWIALNAVATPSLSDVLSVGSMIGADQEIGFTGAVASAAVKGDLLYVASDGEAKLLSSSIADGELNGVALEAGGSGKEIASLLGQKVWMGIAGAAPAVGDLLYVSSTAGKAAVAAPTSGRVLKVGKCVGGVGSGANSGLYPVLFQPQYIADI